MWKEQEFTSEDDKKIAGIDITSLNLSRKYNTTKSILKVAAKAVGLAYFCEILQMGEKQLNDLKNILQSECGYWGISSYCTEKKQHVDFVLKAIDEIKADKKRYLSRQCIDFEDSLGEIMEGLVSIFGLINPDIFLSEKEDIHSFLNTLAIILRIGIVCRSYDSAHRKKDFSYSPIHELLKIKNTDSLNLHDRSLFMIKRERDNTICSLMKLDIDKRAFKHQAKALEENKANKIILLSSLPISDPLSRCEKIMNWIGKDQDSKGDSAPYEKLEVDCHTYNEIHTVFTELKVSKEELKLKKSHQ